MSEHTPPASIALAIAKHTRGSAIPGDNDTRLAEAVWRALLAEGFVMGMRGGGQCLAIPLPLGVSVEPEHKPHA